MAHLALFFKLKGLLVGMAVFIFFENIPVLGVHEVKIKVFYAAGLQLLFKQRAYFLPRFEQACGKLVRQHKRLARIALGYALPYCRFALTAQIHPCGVKIVKARRDIGIHHAGKLCLIHLFSLHGQAHTAKAEVLFYLFKTRHTFPFPHTKCLVLRKIIYYCAYTLYFAKPV